MEKLTLKQYRLIAGLTQAELADRIGVHTNTYSNWEEKPERIRIEKAMRIADVLNININEIFFNN